jgi:hypothetical protein
MNLWCDMLSRPCQSIRLQWCNNSFAPNCMMRHKCYILSILLGFLGRRLQEMK